MKGELFMKRFKKVISLLLTLIILIGCAGSAYANGIEPRDGFSWSHTFSDPSGGGGYGSYGSWSNKSTALDVILSNMTVGALALALSSLIPNAPIEGLREVASMILGGAGGFVTTPMLYCKVRTAYHNTLPGFYKKMEFRWYADSARTQELTSYPTIVYAFKA